jgi:hypothetical protein
VIYTISGVALLLFTVWALFVGAALAAKESNPVWEATVFFFQIVGCVLGFCAVAALFFFAVWLIKKGVGG